MRKKFFLHCLILLRVLCTQVYGQNSAPPLPGRPRITTEDAADNEGAEKMKKTMEKKLNDDREAQIKRDTDKLLRLSTELKEYVDKTNQHLLSVDVIKKAEEIEKLAHSVKEKMRGN